MKQSKITLKYEDENNTITHEIHNAENTWEFHLQRMIEFLRGVGYIIPDEMNVE